MRQQDSSYVPLDSKLVLGPSQRHDSIVVPMANYSALLVHCEVFAIDGGDGALLTVRLQVTSDEENPCWLASEPGWILRATTIGRFSLAPDSLCAHALAEPSRLRVRLRYQTGPNTRVMFSTGIQLCAERMGRDAPGTTPTLNRDTEKNEETAT